jgi:hypothetical protein
MSAVRNLEGGRGPMLSQTSLSSVFSHENENALPTYLHNLMYREGRFIWKQIIQSNQEQ